jgi:hypothetical protein
MVTKETFTFFLASKLVAYKFCRFFVRFFYLAMCLSSIFLPLCLSLYPYFSFSLSLYFSVYLCSSLSTGISVYLRISPCISVSLCICLSFSIFAYLCLCLSLSLFVSSSLSRAVLLFLSVKLICVEQHGHVLLSPCTPKISNL